MKAKWRNQQGLTVEDADIRISNPESLPVLRTKAPVVVARPLEQVSSELVMEVYASLATAPAVAVAKGAMPNGAVVAMAVAVPEALEAAAAVLKAAAAAPKAVPKAAAEAPAAAWAGAAVAAAVNSYQEAASLRSGSELRAKRSDSQRTAGTDSSPPGRVAKKPKVSDEQPMHTDPSSPVDRAATEQLAAVAISAAQEAQAAKSKPVPAAHAAKSKPVPADKEPSKGDAAGRATEVVMDAVHVEAVAVALEANRATASRAAAKQTAAALEAIKSAKKIKGAETSKGAEANKGAKAEEEYRNID